MTSGGIQRRRRMGPGPAIADTADLFSSSQQQRVRDCRSCQKVFKAAEIPAERTTTAQTRCYTTCSNIDPKQKRIHSDFSETTVETVTCSRDVASVCSDDSLTTVDSPTTAISLQLQMQELFSFSPYYLDSTDKLINLPDDLIGEVLRRLSVKEIVRMGCLNRTWRSEMRRLITDEQFNYN